MAVNNVLLIGLCGRSGSGKGYVCRKFAAHGIPSVDTDAIYREMTAPSAVLSPCMQELREEFGDSIVSVDGSLDRRALSSIVFSADGEEKRAVLNRITHRHILESTARIAAEYAAAGAPAVIIDAPLLFESGFDTHCACTVCVTAPTEVSVQRIVQRDGITEEEAHRRLAAQISAEKLIARCDYHIENGLCCPDLEEQVLQVVRAIFSRFSIFGGVP